LVLLTCQPTQFSMPEPRQKPLATMRGGWGWGEDERGGDP